MSGEPRSEELTGWYSERCQGQITYLEQEIIRHAVTAALLAATRWPLMARFQPFHSQAYCASC